jgi:hypothetical protein
MTRRETPSPAAESHRHRHHAYDHARDELPEGYSDEDRDNRPGPVDHRPARIRQALDAAADPSHPHHAEEVRNLELMRAEVPLMVKAEEAIRRDRGMWGRWP